MNHSLGAIYSFTLFKTSPHTTSIGGAPRGPAVRLEKEQNTCLRVVVGAYKAILIRNLEVETLVPPLDLYLNKRLAKFENRLAQPNLQVLVDTSRLKIL